MSLEIEVPGLSIRQEHDQLHLPCSVPAPCPYLRRPRAEYTKYLRQFTRFLYLFFTNRHVWSRKAVMSKLCTPQDRMTNALPSHYKKRRQSSQPRGNPRCYCWIRGLSEIISWNNLAYRSLISQVLSPQPLPPRFWAQVSPKGFLEDTGRKIN